MYRLITYCNDGFVGEKMNKMFLAIFVALFCGVTFSLFCSSRADLGSFYKEDELSPETVLFFKDNQYRKTVISSGEEVFVKVEVGNSSDAFPPVFFHGKCIRSAMETVKFGTVDLEDSFVDDSCVERVYTIKFDGGITGWYSAFWVAPGRVDDSVSCVHRCIDWLLGADAPA